MIEVRECTIHEKKLKTNMEFVVVTNGNKQYFTEAALSELGFKIISTLKV
jgi:hypothetical protein